MRARRGMPGPVGLWMLGASLGLAAACSGDDEETLGGLSAAQVCGTVCSKAEECVGELAGGLGGQFDRDQCVEDCLNPDDGGDSTPDEGGAEDDSCQQLNDAQACLDWIDKTSCQALLGGEPPAACKCADGSGAGGAGSNDGGSGGGAGDASVASDGGGGAGDAGVASDGGGAGLPQGDADSCPTLQACCGQLPAAAQGSCQTVAGQGNAAACQALVDSLPSCG